MTSSPGDEPPDATDADGRLITRSVMTTLLRVGDQARRRRVRVAQLALHVVQRVAGCDPSVELQRSLAMLGVDPIAQRLDDGQGLVRSRWHVAVQTATHCGIDRVTSGGILPASERLG